MSAVSLKCRSKRAYIRVFQVHISLTKEWIYPQCMRIGATEYIVGGYWIAGVALPFMTLVYLHCDAEFLLLALHAIFLFPYFPRFNGS